MLIFYYFYFIFLHYFISFHFIIHLRYARFLGPYGILVVPSTGLIIISDTSNHCIRSINPTTGAVTTIAGIPGSGGSSNGIGTVSAQFYYPTGVASTSGATSPIYIFIADTYNHIIRSLNFNTGEVTTVAGLAGVTTGTIDGMGTFARFREGGEEGLDVAVVAFLRLRDLRGSGARDEGVDGQVLDEQFTEELHRLGLLVEAAAALADQACLDDVEVAGGVGLMGAITGAALRKRG